MARRLKKLIRTIARIFDRDPLKACLYPYRDWFVMLGIALVLIVVIAGTHYYVFVRINAADIFQADVSEIAEEQTLDRVRLENTIRSYQQKQIRFEQLRERGPEAIDPA